MPLLYYSAGDDLSILPMLVALWSQSRKAIRLMVKQVASITASEYILIKLPLKNLTIKMYAKASLLLITTSLAYFKLSDFSLSFSC